MRDYYTSPVRNASIEDVILNFWTDADYDMLPYKKEHMIAWILNNAIRKKSKGSLSMDTFMHGLLERSLMDSSFLVSDDTLHSEMLKIGVNFEKYLRPYIYGGKRLPLDDLDLGRCFEYQEVTIDRFDSNFSFQESKKDRVVKGVVENSNAFKKGLRNGQKILGWSMHGDLSEISVVTIEDERGNPRDIEYWPAKKVDGIPSYQLKKESWAGRNRCWKNF